MNKGKDIWNLGNISKNYINFRPSIPPHYFDKILSFCKNKYNYLDIACGPGNIVIDMHKHFEGAKVGIDNSPSQIGAFQKYIEEKSLQNANIKVLLGDPREIFSLTDDIKLKEQKFDLVTCSQALHYFNYENICNYISKELLAPEGIFAVIGYSARGFDFPNDKSRKLGKKCFSTFYKPIKKYFTFNRNELEEAYNNQNLHNYFSKTIYEEETIITSAQNTSHYINYLKTFSAYQLYLEKHQKDSDFADPLENMIEEIIKYEKESKIKVENILTNFIFFLKIYSN